MDRLKSLGFRITTLEEQLARAESGAVTSWIIPGIIVEGGSILIYAAPGVGKSLLIQDLARAAITGGKWLAAHQFDRQSIMYVDEDGNNDHVLNERLLAMHAKRGPDDAQIHFSLHNGFLITDDVARMAMIADCIDYGVKIIVMDSFTRLHRLRESDANAMKQVNRAIKDYTMAGLTVVMLHHGQQKGKNARGSSEIESGYDTVYRLDMIDNSSFNMATTKSRAIGPNGYWPGCIVHVGRDESGRLVLDGSEQLETDLQMTASKRDEKAAKMRSGVLHLLADCEVMTKTAMANELGNSGRDKELFEDVLARLHADEIIGCEKRGKGFYYWLRGDHDQEPSPE